MKKLLALVLALVMTLGLATVSANAALKDFSDAGSIGADYEEAFAVLNTVDVFQGSNGKLNPTGELTRAEAAKLIAYLDLGAKTAETLPAVEVFPDVPATHWAAKYVAYCQQAGIIQGSNGKYLPDEPLSGYAFGAYLLAVLGYDRNLEEMTGPNWQIKTAKLMSAADISKGVDKVGSATLTRQEAAQYCLNALKADMVQYNQKGTTVVLGGATVTTAASSASVITTGYSNAVLTSVITETGAAGDPIRLQLGEKLYSGDLKRVTTTGNTASDGHKAAKWTWKDSTGTKDITSYKATDTVLGSSYDGTALWDNTANKKSLTYKSTTNAAFIAELNTATATPGSDYKVYINGAEVADYTHVDAGAGTAPTAATLTTGSYYFDATNRVAYVATGTGAWTAVNGNGVLIELADTDDDESTVEKVFYTTYYVGVVKKAPVIRTNAVDGKDYVYVDLDTTDVGNAAVTSGAGARKTSAVTGYEGLVKDDVVTVTKMASGKDIITKSTPTTGRASAKSTANKITVDGTVYTPAKAATAAWTGYGTFSSNGNFYLDQYGYGIYAEAVNNDTKDYLMILENGDYGSSNISGTSNTSFAVFNDGTTAKITVASVDNTNFGDGMTVPTTGAIYSYAKNSDGSYALTSKIVSYVYDTTTKTANIGSGASANGSTGLTGTNGTGVGSTNGDAESAKGVSLVTVKAGSGVYSDGAKTAATGNYATIKGDANTVYVFRNINTAGTGAYDTNYKSTWTVQTGYSNHKAFDNATLSAVVDNDTGYADIIFVYFYTAPAVAADKTNYAYVLSTGYTTVYKDNSSTVDHYEFPAIVDGESVAIKAKNFTLLNGSTGLWVVDYTDGIVTAATKVAVDTKFDGNADSKWRYVQVATLNPEDGGMIVTSAGSFSYTDDCVVYIIDGTTVTKTDVGGYTAADVTGNAYLVNNNAEGSSTDTVNQNILKEIYIPRS